MSTQKQGRGRERQPTLTVPLPKRTRGWKTGPKGLFGLRVSRARRADGTETRSYALAVPRWLGDCIVEAGLVDQQFTVEVVKEGILYRCVD